MADLKKDPASDDFLLTTGPFTGKLGATVAAAGGALFVVQIGGTGSTDADVSAAITRYNASSSTRAVFHIASTFADWGSIETISKPIKFVGIVEGAGLSGSSPPNINFVDTAQPLVEFESLVISGSPGDQEFSIFDSVILKFTNCAVSSTKGSAGVLFDMVPGAGGIGLMTIRAKDSFFDIEASGAGTAILFKNGKANGDIEFHLEHCTFFNLAAGASAGLLASTDNGGSILVFAKDGTVLHRPGFSTTGTGAKDLDVTYDGASLVTDYISGGIESQANVIGGTTTVNGHATYNTIMDVLDADLSIQRALTEYMGSVLNVSAGSYVTTVAIIITASNKVIRGDGWEVVTITSSAGGTDSVTLSGTDTRFSGIRLTTVTSVPSASILKVSGTCVTVEKVEILVPTSGVWTAVSMVHITGNRNWIIDSRLTPTTRRVGSGVLLSGDFNKARGVVFRPTGSTTAPTTHCFDMDPPTEGNQIYNCEVDITTAYEVLSAVRVSGTASAIYDNYFYSGAAGAFVRVIDTQGSPISVRIENNTIEEEVGVPTSAIELKAVTASLIRGNIVLGSWIGSSVGLRTDAFCANNLYAHNHLLAIDTPADRLIQNAADNSEAAHNVVT